MLKGQSYVKTVIPTIVERNAICNMIKNYLSGYSGFLSLSKNMHVRLIGDSKIVLRSECERVCGCLSHLSLCGPVMDWRPVQGVPRLLPDDRWDRLQPPRDPTNGLSGYRK